MMRHYSLIDGAMAYQALCDHPYFVDPTANWCAMLLPTEVRCLAGPILIDMALLAEAGPAVASVVEAVLEGFPGRLHCSTLHSEADLSTLARHLQRFTCFRDDAGQLLGLRIADTRILVNLPAAMTPQQWGEMTGPVHQWTLLNRRGEEIALALPEDRTSLIPENREFTLSDEQLAILASGAEPDRLLDQLNYTPQAMEGRLHAYWELARECIAIWEQSNSDNRDGLLNFARKVFDSEEERLQGKGSSLHLGPAASRDTTKSQFKE
jgi:hypothetical protein